MTSDRIEEFGLAHERDRLELLDVLDALTVDGDAPRPETIDRLVRKLERTFEARQVAEEELRAKEHQLGKAMLEVAAERQRYRELFEHAPVGYLVTDLAGTIRDVNRQGARILGDEAIDLLGTPLADRVVARDRAEFRHLLNDVADSRRAQTLRVRVQAAPGASPRALTAAVSLVGSGAGTSVRWIVALDGSSAAPDGSPPEPKLSTRARLHRKPRVVVAHPQRVFARALGDLLDEMFTGSVLVTPAEPAACLVEVERTQADVALIGAFEGESQLELVRKLGTYRDVAVVVFGAGGDAALDLLAAGADTVVPAECSPEDVVGPMLAAMDGWATLPPELHQLVVDREHTRRALLDGLEDDDVELLRLLARGLGDADISRKLHVSTRTAKRRIAEVYRQLGVNGRAEAAAVAGRAGLLAGPSTDGLPPVGPRPPDEESG